MRNDIFSVSNFGGDREVVLFIYFVAMFIEKSDYHFTIECGEDYAIVQVVLPIRLYMLITNEAGFDRDYERAMIHEEVVGIFGKEVEGFKQVCFENKEALYEYFLARGLETINENNNNGWFKTIVFEFSTEEGRSYFTEISKFEGLIRIKESDFLGGGAETEGVESKEG